MQRRRRRTAVGIIASLACLLAATSCDTPLAADANGVDRIVLTPTSANVQAGTTLTLTALVLDASGNAMRERKVVWSTENASVATVSQSGVVTGVTAGSVQIAASSGGKSANATITVTARPVTLVRVTPGSATIAVTGSLPLQAEALDASGAPVLGRPVAWTSSNESIALVSAGGVVAGIAAGSATITATVDGIAGTAAITVAPQPVASVTITPETETTIVGRRVTFRATPLDANNLPLSARTIVWTSSAATVAAVSSVGEVLALAAGTARIRATVEGKFAEATIVVQPVPVARVVTAPNQITLNPGQTSQLTVTLTDSAGNVLNGRSITYTTSDAQIATVSATGLITAVAEGSAQITAASEDKTATTTVTVNPVPVASIRITPNAVSLRITQTTTLSAQAFDAQGRPLANRKFTWISGVPNVATVNQQGEVTAVGNGTAAVFAATEGISAFATVTVSNVPVASVQIVPPTLSLQQGGSATLSAVARDSAGTLLTGRVVTWSSSNDAVAVVSSTGRVTAVSPGNAIITATSESVTGTCNVTVSNVPVASVTITPANPTLGVGQSLGMTAIMRDAAGNILTGRAVTWTAPPTGIVTIDAQGVVTAVASGSATITATSEGVSGTTVITVSTGASVTVRPKPNTIYQGATKSLRAVYVDGFGNVVRGRNVSWQSRNPALVTVSQVGGTPDSATYVGDLVALGSTYVVAEDPSGLRDSTQVTVAQVPVASVQLTPSSPSLQLPDSVTLTAQPKDSAGGNLTRTITWVALNPSIATVAPTGANTAKVNTLSSGSATVEARANGAGAGGVDVVATAAITVTAVVHTVQVTSARNFIVPRDTMHLSVVLRDTLNNVLTGKPIAYMSSDNNIASVDASGVVTGGANAGSATISATSEGKSGSVTVNGVAGIASVAVTGPDNNIVTDTLLLINTSKTYTVTVKDSTGNPLSGRVFTVTNSNPSAMAVAPTTVTTDAQGTATVGATAGTAGMTSSTITFTGEPRHGAIPPGAAGSNNPRPGSIRIVVP